MSVNRKSWQTAVLVAMTLITAQTVWARSALNVAWKRTYQEAEAEARRLDRPLLLHFGATWCGPCKQMEAQVLNSPDVRRALKDQVVGVKIDIDHNPEIAQRYGVDSVPADVIIEPNGKILVPKTVGGMSRDAYVGKLASSAQLYLRTKPAPTPPTPPSPPVPSEIAEDSASQQMPPIPAPSKSPLVAMEGYCPVTLWRTRQWIKGSKKYGADYQGVRYYFQTLEDRDDFIAEPARYAPQLLGCDPVVLRETERAIVGTPKFAAFFDGELFLFTNYDHRVKFKAHPEQFTKTRHVNLDDIEHADTRLGMKN